MIRAKSAYDDPRIHRAVNCVREMRAPVKFLECDWTLNDAQNR